MRVDIRNRFRRTILASVLACSIAGAPAFAEAPVEPAAGAEASACEAGFGETVARKVQAHYEEIRDLKAQFRQTNDSASFGGRTFGSADAKEGRVVFSKPGKMSWKYEKPDPSMVVSNGRLLWVYDVESKSATRFEVTEGFLTGAALQFLLGDGKILESFDVTATTCATSRVVLDLLPKTDSTYERLGLDVDPRDGAVLATSVVDLFGNRTAIEFSEIETNLNPDASVFEFTAPDGVETLEFDGSPAS